ncbi:hypothetical protein SAMN05444392_104166 [Seinonella peptonophila]|uniref:Uncharacterized protein n=1 Tax=Seinonella peptonophila TaxID=112248 RepID=A0A1M4X716_9BACL|nr:hypothetical protein SAMN05444392_104166 [Seinonella peptonophila]
MDVERTTPSPFELAQVEDVVYVCSGSLGDSLLVFVPQDRASVRPLLRGDYEDLVAVTIVFDSAIHLANGAVGLPRLWISLPVDPAGRGEAMIGEDLHAGECSGLEVAASAALCTRTVPFADDEHDLDLVRFTSGMNGVQVKSDDGAVEPFDDVGNELLLPVLAEELADDLLEVSLRGRMLGDVLPGNEQEFEALVPTEQLEQRECVLFCHQATTKVAEIGQNIQRKLLGQPGNRLLRHWFLHPCLELLHQAEVLDSQWAFHWVIGVYVNHLSRRWGKSQIIS